MSLQTYKIKPHKKPILIFRVSVHNIDCYRPVALNEYIEALLLSDLGPLNPADFAFHYVLHEPHYTFKLTEF
jgi:hypothetical protein